MSYYSPKRYQRKYQRERSYHKQRNSGSYSENKEEKKKSEFSFQNNNAQFLEIDGSTMEGGGQVVRNSMSLSVLANRPIYLYNIRGKRNNPGLRAQHSMGLSLVQQINGGILEGNYIKSTEVSYCPNLQQNLKNVKSDYYVDTKTAGSVCLLIQIALPVLLFNPIETNLTLIGGTNASFAPPIDYFLFVLQPMLKKLMDIDINFKIIQRGFYPKGGGKVLINIKPITKCIKPFNLTKKGFLSLIKGVIVIGGRHKNMNDVNVIKDAIKNELQLVFDKNIPIQIEIDIDNKSYSNGINVILCAETNEGCLIGASYLHEVRKKNNFNPYHENQDIGIKAAKALINEWYHTGNNGCTDRWLQDQLIIFMALANGKSSFQTCNLELHTTTAIHFAELITGVKFNITEDKKNGSVLIECNGIGINPQ